MAPGTLRTGEVVQGRWSGRSLRIEGHLGVGANGSVYLVRTPQGLAAMKMCDNSSDIALEWGLLERLTKVSGAFPRPLFVDDDAARKDMFFYVMEWVPGSPLSNQVNIGGDEATLYGILSASARGFRELHAAGYAFGDVKPQNLLVSQSSSQRVRFVDVGGVTPWGRSVRQFTPHFDRAFWNLGTRKADPAYDLSGLSLCLLFCAGKDPPPSLLERRFEERRQWLYRELSRQPMHGYSDVFRGVFDGVIVDAATFDQKIQEVHHRQRSSPRGKTFVRSPSGARNRSSGPAPVSMPTPTKYARGRIRSRSMDWTEKLMWTSVVLCVLTTLGAWGAVLGWRL